MTALTEQYEAAEGALVAYTASAEYKEGSFLHKLKKSAVAKLEKSLNGLMDLEE